MRACVLAYTFYEADGRVIRYAEALAQRGDHVDVVSLRRNGQPYHEEVRGVHVYRIQDRPVNENGKMQYLARLVKFLFGTALFVMRRHAAHPYQIVHVHSVPDFEVFAAFFAKLGGAKIILDIHDIVPEFYQSKFGVTRKSLAFQGLAALEKISGAFAHHVIVSNHLWRKTLTARSIQERKCSVVMNYPDREKFHKRTRTRQDDRFILFYPGTLSRHQGIDIAVRALGKIRDRAPEAEFHIYGDGPERRSLEKQSGAQRLHDRIFLKDILPIEKIADLMGEADLGIVPKRNDPFGGEAFSTKILEFMAVGIPVLVSRTKIDQYYFNDDVVSFFRPEDDDDLAEKLLNLIRDRDARRRLCENASKFVEEHTWAKAKVRYYELVDSLRNGHNSSAPKLNG
jgi:glycosyltransferase involved in cell wall biosynthesis